MATKVKTYFSCQACGGKSPKWMGRCPDCGEWNTLIEETEEREGAKRWTGATKKSAPVRFSEIESVEDKREGTGISEFDRVLGGGIVPGSFVLIGGDPGIGKSTILLQVALNIAKKNLPVLYITGEESEAQVRMRGDRIGAPEGPLYLLSEIMFEEIIPCIDKLSPNLIIIDSIQTMYTSQLQSAPGSVSQVREVTARLLQLAKKRGITVFLIGHVTKEGAIAGPRVLEHMVDTVLYFEGDRGHTYRIIRAVKNRFGSSNEIGVFEMGVNGLKEVTNPSELFLSERPSKASGSVVTAIMEGRRPLLIEIQALVSRTNYGMARRNVNGLDSNRVSLLVALLEKRVGLNLTGEDIFLNVTGGVSVNDPGVDLAIMAAIASSFKEIPIETGTLILGEVGLSGEVRGIAQINQRLSEAEKLGLTRCILPQKKTGHYDKRKIELIEVTRLNEMIELLFK